MHVLLDFVEALKVRHIHFDLAAPTRGAIMVQISVPGERWEVEFREDGSVDVEVFESTNGVTEGKEKLKELFERFTDL